MSTLITSPDFIHPYSSNEAFYDGWAASYDKGNILQRLDDELFKAHIAPLLSALPRSDPVHLLDMGCGTGRNTIKLPGLLPSHSQIMAVDSSKEMLAGAKKKLEGRAQFLHAQIDSLEIDERFDIIISTLVLEHLPLEIFFQAVGRLLKVGGWAWVTSMHPDMSSLQAKASFTDSNNQKIAGTSWNHSIDGTIDVANKEGLKLNGGIKVGKGKEGEEDI